MENNYFEVLNALNVNEHTEKKKAGSTELTYLSWSWAVAEILKKFPDMTYKIIKFQDKNGNLVPYMYDENTGYMCMTEVTISGITREMWLPVMDSSNKAMKKESYTYLVKEYKYNPQTRKTEATGKMIEKIVEPASMFDINKTLMRCLTKNFAMFGLGLYIFAGEDLPESDEEKEEITPAQKANATRAVNKEIKITDLDKRYNDWLNYWMNHEWSQPANESFRRFLDEAKDYDPEKMKDLIKVFKDKTPEDNDSMPDWA